jgi:hypothetical protein
VRLGILAHFLGIPAVHNENFLFWDNGGPDLTRWRPRALIAAHGFPPPLMRQWFAEIAH